MRPSPYSYKFGDVIRAGLGTIEIRTHITTNYYLRFWIDVVDADNPFLQGLDLFDR